MDEEIKSALELSTNEELIDELMHRVTFCGVVVRMKDDVKGDWHGKEKDWVLHYNQNTTKTDLCKIFTQVTEQICE